MSTTNCRRANSADRALSWCALATGERKPPERPALGGSVARRVVVMLVDDVDGSPARETVMFGLDGRVYELDLSREHAAMLRGRLGRFVAAARTVDGPTPPARRPASSAPDPPLSKRNRRVRFWARQRGISVPAQGPVPAGVTEAYRRDRLGWQPEYGLQAVKRTDPLTYDISGVSVALSVDDR